MGSVLRAGVLAVVLVGFALAGGALNLFGRAGSRLAWALGRLFCRTLLALLKVRVEVIGAPLPGGPGAGLLACNHVSWLDPLVLGTVADLCPLAKREVAGWPLIGTFARLQEAVLVDRTRRMGVGRVNRAMAARMLAGRPVLLFPEGTTLDGTRRGPFRTAHFGCLKDLIVARGVAAPALVQPVALCFSDPGAAWVGDDALVPHVWWLLGRPGLTCRLVFGPARTVAPGYDRKALARAVAADVEALLVRPEAVVPERAAAQRPVGSRSQSRTLGLTTGA